EPAGWWVPRIRGISRALRGYDTRIGFRFHRCCVFNSHERAVARPEQELGINERPQQRFAEGGLEPPEPSSLCFGETQSRHLEEFTLNPPKNILGLERCGLR